MESHIFYCFVFRFEIYLFIKQAKLGQILPQHNWRNTTHRLLLFSSECEA